MAKNCAANRKRFSKLMENGSALALFAGEAPVKRGDEFYPFAPQRNFYYLTGIDAPRVIFLMVKNASGEVTEKLFLERYDELAAKWVGAPMPADAAGKISELADFAYIDQFDEEFTTLLVRRGVGRVYLDLECRSLSAPVTADVAFSNRLTERFPAVTLVDAYPLFARLRMVKAKEEIRAIRRAAQITSDGVTVMMQKARQGMMEYEIEAHFLYTLMKNGVRQAAFPSIIAAGANAATLHYGANNTRVKDGDLVLCDVGAQVNWYSADLTRTFPVSGVFTERQKQLYNIVLEGQKKVIAAVKPGAAFASLNETLRAHYAKELKRIGLIKKKEEVSRYYYHGVSHLLGLETHDAGRGAEGGLKPGMVLTVEPGLYIAEENIGIRIEDDVLVTESGCEVLSDGLAKTVEEIEALMARKGRSYVTEIQ